MIAPASHQPAWKLAPSSPGGYVLGLGSALYLGFGRTVRRVIYDEPRPETSGSLRAPPVIRKTSQWLFRKHAMNSRPRSAEARRRLTPLGYIAVLIG